MVRIRCLLLIALMALAACNADDKVSAHVDVPADNASQDSEFALDEGVDDNDTAWMDEIQVDLPPVWHGEQPPLRVETRHFMHGTTGLRDHYVILRAHDDVLELQGLTLNRGNCPYSETDQVVNGVHWPQQLLFGQRKQVRAKCDKVIEAQVLTQYGEWTFSFD